MASEKRPELKFSTHVAKGKSKAQLPDSFVGALSSFNRQGIRALCFTCGETKPITKVTGIEQYESRADYSVILSCTHTRQLSIAVSRSEAKKAVLDASRKKAAAARKKLELSEDTGEPACALDSDEVETEEIRATMRESGVLTESVEETEDEPAELGLPLIRVWDRGAS